MTNVLDVSVDMSSLKAQRYAQQRIFLMDHSRLNVYNVRRSVLNRGFVKSINNRLVSLNHDAIGKKYFFVVFR